MSAGRGRERRRRRWTAMAAATASGTHVLALADGDARDARDGLHAELLHGLAALLLRAALLAAVAGRLCHGIGGERGVSERAKSDGGGRAEHVLSTQYSPSSSSSELTSTASSSSNCGCCMWEKERGRTTRRVSKREGKSLDGGARLSLARAVSCATSVKHDDLERGAVRPVARCAGGREAPQGGRARAGRRGGGRENNSARAL